MRVSNVPLYAMILVIRTPKNRPSFWKLPYDKEGLPRQMGVIRALRGGPWEVRSGVIGRPRMVITTVTVLELR